MASFVGRIGATLLAGIAGFLASCGDGPASNVSYKHANVWDMFFFGASQGPVLVELDGEPFLAARDLGTALTTAMKSAFSEPYVNFTTDRALAGSPDQRIIWTFNPAPGYDMNRVCERRPAGGPPGDRLVMRAALCQGGQLLAAVHGWMRTPQDGSDDRRWQSLVAQMARQLVSQEGR